MIQSIKLSKRLQMVASFLPDGAMFADIGSDHAYLPCYICLQDGQARAIAGEINEGPYQSACNTVEANQLLNVIDVRLGNGLQVLKKGEVTELVIAGMGGALIRDILEDGNEKLQNVKRIIAQPNIDGRNVRRWFLLNGFNITNEVIMEENDHIYEVIVADREEHQISHPPELTEKQLLFGPLLMATKDPIFIKKWRLEQMKLNGILKQIKQATIKNDEKVVQFETELAWIGEVLER